MSKNARFKYSEANGNRIIAKLDDTMSVVDEVYCYCSKPTAQVVSGISGIVSKLAGLDAWKKSYSGVALLDPNDTYNLEAGERVARLKAVMKHHDYMARKYGQVLKVLNKAIDEMDLLYTKHVAKAILAEREYRRFCENGEFSSRENS